MNDYAFGNKLLALRSKCRLTQAELAERIGVSNKAVSKWENGRTKPGVDVLRRLALALHVSIDELLAEAERTVSITKIVVTGGPCAGKTTALSWIQNAFSKLGYSVLFVSEAATELISGGAAPWLCSSAQDFQACLIRLQRDKERAFERAAALMKTDKVLIVCDRGALDNRAYMNEIEFQYVLNVLRTNEVELRDAYDAVFHLVTAADGAEAFYTLANNQARTETPEQARSIDRKLLAAWTGHPHLRVIDNSTDFNDKMLRLIGEVSSFLGEPEPLEIERKFLIEYPDLKRLERMENCSKVDIIQTYLCPNGNEDEVRIRQRGANGNYVYYKTVKRRVSKETRVEIEERLSQEQYLKLLLEADPSCRQIRKTRYCLSQNSLYYEIDVYPARTDSAILEIELRDEDQPVVIPKFLHVIKEVTGDEAYTNHAMAKI